jgi:prepilin-type N-terminal cleavage/methylation domain-containing protein
MLTGSKIIKSHGGYSMLEMLVAVAIIGILATIAIPVFRKYEARARTAEATVMLSALYTAETSYRIEYDSYTACVVDAGFAPNPGKRFYRVGFSRGAVLGNFCGRWQNAPCNLQGWESSTGGKVCTLVNDQGDEFSYPATMALRLRGEVTAVLPGDGDLHGTQISASAFVIAAAGPTPDLDYASSSDWFESSAFAAPSTSASGGDTTSDKSENAYRSITLDHRKQFGFSDGQAPRVVQHPGGPGHSPDNGPGNNSGNSPTSDGSGTTTDAGITTDPGTSTGPGNSQGNGKGGPKK